MSSKHKEVPDKTKCNYNPKCYTFLESSDKIQLNDDRSNHHDPHQEHQEPQEDKGCPQSIKRFLTTIFNLTPQVLYIFGNLTQNPVQ